jgi:ribonuclease-3
VSLDPSRLCNSLGYEFHTPELLLEALTHRSASSKNNERFEFLGDAILNFVIGEAVFQYFPHASEGDLSRLRATRVRGTTLAEIARSLNLSDYLRLGTGELKSGGFRRSSILADALEAICGAVYLDSDFTACRTLILNLYQERLIQLPSVQELKDPKTRLQEYLQAQQKPLPVYSVIEVSGADHARCYKIRCTVETLHTTASGSNRRKAEQEAAQKALELLK